MNALPAEIVIEVTGRCNFNCEGCFNRYSFAEEGRNYQETGRKIKEVILAVKKAGVKVVRFTGGEPMLRADLFELIVFAHNLSLEVRLNTNASLIRPEHLPFFDKYVDSVLVSFNGFDSRSDAKWTQVKDSFSHKIKGLSLLGETRTKLRLGTVLTPDNLENLDKIFPLVHSLKPFQWEVYREVTRAREHFFKAQLPVLMDQLLTFSVRMGSLVKIANAIPFCAGDKEKMSLFCLGAVADDGHSRFVVDPRGHSKPSYFINESIGLPEEILTCWDHPFMKEMRLLKMMPDRCRDCEYAPLCKGGSRYKARLINGSYQAPDPLMESRD